MALNSSQLRKVDDDINPFIELPSDLNVNIDGVSLKLDLQTLRTIKKLGEGSFSTVELRKHFETNFQFAVKVCNKLDAEALKTILKDIKIGQSVVSKFKINYYGAIQDSSYVCIIMEPMEMSVKDFYQKWLSKDSTFHLPSSIIGYFTYCSIYALEDLHVAGIIHRDIKPSNMLIDREGRFKLCDFGISGILKNSLAESAVGTNAYLSPERINPKTSSKPYNIKADIWSLGLSMMEIVMMKFPYHEATSIMSQLFAIVEGPLPTISASTPYINDHDMIEFFTLTLAKKKRNRKTYNELKIIKFISKYNEKEVFKDAKRELAELVDKLLLYINID